MRKQVLFSLIALLLFVTGCNSTKPIVLTVTSPTGAQALDIGQTFNISVTVSHDKLNKGATFTLTGVGTLTNVTATGATYTAAASGNATVTIASAADPTKKQTIAIVVTAPPSITNTSSTFAAAVEGTAYTASVTETGGAGTLTYSVTVGSLPAGLSLSSSTGAITGTATGPNGTFTFTIQVKDSSTSAPQTASESFSLTVNLPAPPTITTTSLAAGTEGTAYSQTLTGTCPYGPCTWSLASGSSLPTGLMLSASTGAITGTPTGPAGASNFTVVTTDKSNPAQTATKALSITVNLPGPPSLSPTTLPGGNQGTVYSQTITVSGGLAPYSGWAVSSGTLPTGVTLNGSGSSAALAGTPTAQGTFTFSISVNDSSNPAQTATQSYTVIIGAPLPLTVTTSSLPAGTVGTAYPSTSLTATGGIAPYTWTWVAASGSSLPPGLSLSTSGAITGTPTAAGTFNVTVTVTDSATPTANTASANFSITVSAVTCGSGSESLLNGGYAFLLKGFDSSNNPALVGGVLTFNGAANSGLITAGAIDMNLAAGVQTNLTVTSGTYSVGSDQRGCMTITTSAGTQNYRFSLGNITSGVASTAHVIDFDTTGPFTAGTMRLQSGGPFSTSSVNGTFAFGGSSPQNAAECNNSICGGKSGVAGVITFNGSGGVSSGSEDINQNGVLDGSSSNANWPATSPITFSNTSSYTMASNGRGTLAIVITGITGTLNSTLYVVSSSEAFFMSTDAQTTNSISAGQSFLQSGTPFAANPLSGSYIGYDSGLGSSSGRTDIILLGPLTSGNSTLTGTQLRNDSGTFTSSAIGGTYSVSPAGRVLITVSGSNHQPVLYLVSATQAFFLNGNGGVDFGFFQAQTGSPFSNSSASGIYAFGPIDPEDSGGSVSSGVANFTPPSTLNVTSDDNSSGTLSPDQTESFSYSINSTGLGMIPSSGSSCTVSATSTTCQTLFYVISPTKAAVLDTTSSNPKVQIADK